MELNIYIYKKKTDDRYTYSTKRTPICLMSTRLETLSENIYMWPKNIKRVN